MRLWAPPWKENVPTQSLEFKKCCFPIAECHLSQKSASDRCRCDAQRHDLSVMTLRASMATFPALACSLLVTASPCLIGWHTFAAPVWFFTHKHILLFLAADVPAQGRIHYVKGSFILYISRPFSMPPACVVLFLLSSDVQERTCCILTRVLNSRGHRYSSHFPCGCFPVNSGIGEQHFSPPCRCCSSPHEFCKPRVTLLPLWSVCRVKPSLRRPFSFMYGLQHVSERLLPLTQRGIWAANRQNHDA